MLVTLALAAGNRDPRGSPTRIASIPSGATTQHLGFGSGIHSCFGAPLARMEAQIAFTELAAAAGAAAAGRGPATLPAQSAPARPAHLLIDVDGVRESLR